MTITGSSKPLALVTGASRGIGAACSHALALQGYHVFISYIRNEEAARTVLAAMEAQGGTGELLRFDVADQAQCASVLTPLCEARGPFSVLILNAGVRADAPLALMLPEEWRQVLDVNLLSFYNVVKPVLKGMLLARAGKIIAMASVSGQSGMPGQVNYSASKAGVIGAVKALAREVGKRKITVNAIAPGFIETEMLHGLNAGQLAQMIPLGRVGRPEEVAQAMLFLLSSSYITGQVLGVNGGIYI
jgi:3-oxoacyl-[acyl-carrier protein] reductase